LMKTNPHRCKPVGVFCVCGPWLFATLPFADGYRGRTTTACNNCPGPAPMIGSVRDPASEVPPPPCPEDRDCRLANCRGCSVRKWRRRRRQLYSGTYGSAALTVDGLYTAGPCTVFDLSPVDGSVIWTNNTGCEGGGGETPVVASQTLFAPISGFYSGDFYNAESGALLGGFNYSAPPAVSATSIYTLTASTLQAASLSNNQIAWSFVGDGMLTTSAVVVNSYVFVGSTSGNLYALDAATGNQLWTENLGAAIAGPATGGSAYQGQTGLAAGDGILVVPAGNSVTAFVLSTNP